MSVNKEKFPALSDINAGEKIIAVNDLATTYMKGTNLRYWLDANGNTATISFKGESNNIKIVTIEPQFTPASSVEKNHKEAIAKIPQNTLR